MPIYDAQAALRTMQVHIKAEARCLTFARDCELDPARQAEAARWYRAAQANRAIWRRAEQDLLDHLDDAI